MVAQFTSMQKIVLNFVRSVTPVGIVHAKAEFNSEQENLENVRGQDEQEHTRIFLCKNVLS